MKFGDNLRKIRKSKKMSQEQLAEKMNVTFFYFFLFFLNYLQTSLD